MLVAGVRTARLDSSLDVTENWWGTTDLNEIKTKIFDFDDWNNHALANFKPYLIEQSFEGSLSVSIIDFDSILGVIEFFYLKSLFRLHCMLGQLLTDGRLVPNKSERK